MAGRPFRVFGFGFFFVLLFSTVILVSRCEQGVEEESIRDTFSAEHQEILKSSSESHEFQAEVSRLMDIIINSLYTQKEVFLRELISNAADALEKVRFLAVSDRSILERNPSLDIRIEVDPELQTVTIQDSGIGMTKNELVKNLGTVARSGTTNFLEAIAQSGDVNLVGQFGVGFYSAYLVADKVTVTSKADADEQHIWESRADAKFTVAPDPRGNTLGRGTRITLHLKDDSTEFLDLNKIRDVANRFNQFVNFPILLRAEKTEEITNEEGEKEQSTFHVWERLNTVKPIWMRSKDEINETEYNEFYKSIAKDPVDPLAFIHFTAEGEVDFRSILYVPSHEPYDAWASYFSSKQEGVKVYARRVLVADSVYDLLPKWLNFIKGVVDSDDLPLKVDRESLSQTRMMKMISKKVVGKFFEMIRKLSKDDLNEWKDFREHAGEAKAPRTKYMQFWKNFGKNMKVGCVEDDANRDKIVRLFRFHSTLTGDNETTTLEEYVDRMPEEQKNILFIANENFGVALKSPHIQIYKNRGWEVLVLQNPLDESCFQRVISYEGHPLVSVEKSNAKIDYTEDEKAYFKKLEKVYKPLTNFFDDRFKNRVARVRISQSLVNAPAVITAEAYGHSAYAERILRSQTFAGLDPSTVHYSRVFEYNPDHPLSKRLLALVKESQDDPQLGDLADSLFDTAMLSSGFIIDDPHRIVKHLEEALRSRVGVPVDATVEKFEMPPDVAEDDDDFKESGDIDMSEFDEEAFADLLKSMPKENPDDFLKEHEVVHDEL